jgi:hypothetical protein
MIAHYQSARDGAAIVRYLDEFYNIAHGRPATALECAYISFTCDIQALNIWLHWRELDAAGAATYYMKSIFDCTLRNEKHILEARGLLWNHIEYALDSRLRSLKDVLHSFCTEFPKQKFKTTKAVSSSRASVHFSIPSPSRQSLCRPRPRRIAMSSNQSNGTTSGCGRKRTLMGEVDKCGIIVFSQGAQQYCSKYEIA